MKSNQWSKFFKPLSVPRYIKLINCHRIFLEVITSMAEKQDKILGIGCGTAVDEIYLSQLGFKVSAIDIDDQVLNQAKHNNQYLHGLVEFIKADMFQLPFSDKEFKIAISQGVLEHFKIEQIQKALKEQLRVVEYVVFSVPSFRWQGQAYGDENLWPLKKWLKIIKEFQIIRIQGYSYRKSYFYQIDKLIRKLFGTLFNKAFVSAFAGEYCFVITKK